MSKHNVINDFFEKKLPPLEQLSKHQLDVYYNHLVEVNQKVKTMAYLYVGDGYYYCRAKAVSTENASKQVVRSYLTVDALSQHSIMSDATFIVSDHKINDIPLGTNVDSGSFLGRILKSSIKRMVFKEVPSYKKGYEDLCGVLTIAARQNHTLFGRPAYKQLFIDCLNERTLGDHYHGVIKSLINVIATLY